MHFSNKITYKYRGNVIKARGLALHMMRVFSLEGSVRSFLVLGLYMRKEAQINKRQ
jgi:hypothetical protein